VTAIVAASVLLAGCAGPSGTVEPPTAAPVTPTPEGTEPVAGPVVPEGEPAVVASGLAIPWSVVPLAGGGALVSERETALVKEVAPDGSVREVAEVPGVVPDGEAGLLGLAMLDDGGTTWLYAYVTAADDNRVLRMPLTGEEGGYGLDTSAPEVVLSGIAKASNHDGGRIAFGPDGALYVTAGDANDRPSAQDPESLNGKILRVAPDGSIPADNPFPGSPVYTLGHRNPQGIAWDADGGMWAAEFGQDTWDEFNRIEPGANYGWPVVEGQAGDADYVDPVLQWSPADASPSGLASIGGTFFLAALRGQRIWSMTVDDAGAAQATPYFEGGYGRIRDVAEGPDGSLWFLTNNTGDDALLRVALAPASGG